MHHPATFFLRLLIPAIVLLSTASATATDIAFDISSIRIGTEGFYKNGLWTPVDIDCFCADYEKNGPWDVAVTTTDSDGTPITYRSTGPPRKTTDAGFSARIYVKLGRKDGSVTVRIGNGSGSALRQIHPSGDPIKERQRQTEEAKSCFFEPISSERPIYLIVGNENIGLQGAVAELSLREERRPLLVKVNSFADLPDQWFGYEAIDTVVLTTTEPKQLDGMTSESPQIQALDRWVKLGGRLLFFPGRDSEPFLKPENGALRPFLPGKYNGMTEIRHGTPLELFVTSKRQILMNGTEDAPFIRVPDFTEPRGFTYVKDGDLPLVLRCAHGLGTIVYFGGDLSEKPLRDWRDRITLVRAVMQWDAERSTTVQRGGALIQLGYNDISGQIRSALDQFDGVRILPFSVILIVLAGYWLVVGPVDWFLVQKVLKRPVMTWITFPAWIVIFCVLCYVWLSAPGRPNRVMVNELDLVDFDTETKTLRQSTWGNLYSPRDATYSPVLYAEGRPTLFSWNGLPGSGLGGMAPKTVSPTVWQTGSEHIFVQKPFSVEKLPDRWPLASIENVPIQVRSTKSFYGQSWLTDHNALSMGATVELVGMEGVPVGTLHWPNSMPPLDNCQLVYGRWAQDIGSLEPGNTINVGKTTARQVIHDLLLPKDAQEDAVVRRVASYNPQSTDLDYIVRVLTFHGAVGGVDGVGLSNAFQRSLDMSDLLRLGLGRTILIGTIRDSKGVKFGPGLAINEHADRLEKRRTIIFRQSIPIRDVAERTELREDGLAPPVKPTDQPGGYDPGFK